MTRILAAAALLLATSAGFAQQVGTSPVRIFILAGQSNMEGQGDIASATTPGTLEHLVANDPGGDYQFLVDGGGSWVVRDDVWIRDESPAQGGLTAGWGANSGKIGPELGFGHMIGDLNESQVLIVKAAWGGKSLAVDFRPPSSGGTTGFYYNEILRLVNEATANLGTYFPDYDDGGYEIVGFGWHQGWNDRVDPVRSAEYESNMANFIRDIRSSANGLGIPDLPFVIATTGMDGGDAYTVVEQAQLAMANTTAYPDFAGNVSVIDTRSTYQGMEFWQPEEDSPAVEGYHWNRSAKTYVNIGLAMGDAMSLMVPGRCPFRLRATGGPGGVTLSWQNGTETPTSVRILRNGSEIAAAAPADPPTFLDASAEPGVLDYELQFTMPGDPCDPLTTTLDGGITDLALSPGPGGFELTWTNNMSYTAIEIRRDGSVLEAALSGTATSYTDSSPPNSGTITYTVAPTTGTSTPATIQINLDLAGELGVFNPILANGGINPATGSPWAVGDQYRLAFLSSTGTQATSTDIATYNAFVQGLANAAGLGGGTWKVLGSTAAVAARDNTSTNPGTDGEGVPIFLMDGATKIADNHTDLWNGNLDQPLNIDENGTGNLTGSVFTGSEPNGTQRTNGRIFGGSSEVPPVVTIGDVQKTNSQWMVIFNAQTTSSLPVYALSEPLTVVDSADNTPPTLDSFLDDKTGGPVSVFETVTYTVTFSEAMNVSSVGTDDFDNASTAAIFIDRVSPTGDAAVFEVEVTATGSGTLRLRVKPGAVMADQAGNLLDAGAASPDDTVITIDSPAPPYPVIQPAGSLILDTTLLSLCMGRFNEEDRWFFGVDSDLGVSTINNGVYGGQFVKNADAYDYLKDNIPLFDCPDPDFIKTYYYRWWTYRKHIKNLGTEGSPSLIVTEFIDPVNWADSTNAINAPLGHQIYEGRWLQDDRVMDDYQRYWLTNPAARPRNYSTWLADAVLANHRVNPDMTLLTELLTSTTNLENLESNHDKWVNGVGTGGGASLRSDGLFWQNDDRDAMEVSFGGSGKRPSINSYMYADARAIAEMFRLAAANDPASAATYNAKADSFDQQADDLRSEVQAHLWDPADEFFKTGYDDFDTGGSLHGRREQIGFTPWAFGLPEDGGAVDYDLAWSHLGSFITPVGLTSGANDETGYNTGAVGQCCRWDGPVWPYATTITLRGLANLLQDYEQLHVDAGDYFDQLNGYTESHRQTFTQDGQTRTIMWVDESMVSGGADAGEWTQIGVTRDGATGNDNPRGLAYNHSGYVDLIITGLAGLRPDTGELVRVAPLLPDNTWDWFLLDNIRYHDRFLTILWDRTGAKYGRGAGLKVYADGDLIASAPDLDEVLGTLATTPDTLLTATNPPDGATDLPATTSSLTATFNRPIQAGTGTIDLMRSTGGGDVLVETFDVTSSPGLGFDGATVTITPANPLVAGSDYHVLIDATAVQGDSGTFFSGITDPTGWNFATDGTPPAIIDRTPPPGAPAVSIRTDLAITFSEAVAKGSGTIIVRRTADDSAVQTIDVNHPDVTIDGTEVSIVLADLAVDTFHVEIAGGAFTDLSGNPFAGISGPAEWSFTTSPTAGVITASLLDEDTDIENTGFALVSACHFQNPTSGDPSPLVVNGIPHTVGRNNVANLTQNMSFEGDFRNGGSGLPQGGGDVIQVLLSGIAGANGITMSISGLTVGQEYLFQAYWEANGTNPQQTLVATIEGDTLNAIGPQGTPGGVLISYQFTAGDETLNAVFDRDDGATTGDQNNWLSGYSLQEVGSTAGPALNATDPADDATDVSVSTNLVATFDKAVEPGSGSISLYKADDTLVEAIAVTDTTPPGTVTFSGSQVTIDPSAPLETGEDYYVLIGSSAITDTSSNPFEGISDKTVWNFATGNIALESALGVLDLSANGGINPATGAAWQAGDTYRLVFLTSQTTTATSADIATYNAFVQGVAASSSTFPNLGAGTWKVVGSTATVDARDNTGTNPGTDGTGVAVFLMDGATAIAINNTDLWNGISQPVGLNENGSPDFEQRVFTGTLANGTKVTGTGDQPLGSFGTGLGNIRAGESSKSGGNWMTDFNTPHDTQHKVFAMSDPLTLTAIAGDSFADFMDDFPGVGAENAFTDDPDGDRLPNGVEAFFGTSPDSPNAGISDVSVSGSTLSFTHPEADPPLTDVVGSYEWSLDLSAWSDSADEVSGTTVTISALQDTPTAGTTTVTALVTGTEPGKVFVRAVATRN